MERTSFKMNVSSAFPCAFTIRQESHVCHHNQYLSSASTKNYYHPSCDVEFDWDRMGIVVIPRESCICHYRQSMPDPGFLQSHVGLYVAFGILIGTFAKT